MATRPAPANNFVFIILFLPLGEIILFAFERNAKEAAALQPPPFRISPFP
jgi:hypothetical protein